MTSNVDPVKPPHPAAVHRHADFIAAQLQSSPPHKHASLIIRHHRAVPDELIRDLKAIGFLASERQATPRLPGHPQETVFDKPGSDLFASWTDAERKKNLADVRRVLKKHNLHPGTLRRLPAPELV